MSARDVDTTGWDENDPRYLQLAYDLLIETTTRIEVALEHLETKRTHVEPKPTAPSDKVLLHLFTAAFKSER